MRAHIVALVFIFLCTTIAWAILGTTIFNRTYSHDSTLKNQVTSIWGAPHVQKPPAALATEVTYRQEANYENRKRVVRTVKDETTVAIPLEMSRINVDLDLEHRQKGLLWYSTYKVGFAGEYVFRNTSKGDLVTCTFYFPTTQAIYDDLVGAVPEQALLAMFEI